MVPVSRFLSVWLAHPWWVRLSAAGFALALGWLALLLNQPFFSKLQEQSTDLIWRATASAEVERRVIFVDIDDASLQAQGPWPWPRTVVADLTRALDRAGVGLKLFDVVFPDARPGDAELAAALKTFSSAGREAPSVLAQVFALRNESRLRSGALAGALPGIGCQAPAVPAQGFIANAPGLQTGFAGHITPSIDRDGAVRAMAALVCMDEKVFPALALAGVTSLERTASSLRIEPGVSWSEPAWKLSLAALPGHAVGVGEGGQIRIPFTVRREALTRVSASDVLTGNIPAGLLDGAWVVIGSSAFGLADVVPVALGGSVSGAEVHLQLLLGMLDNRVPFTPKGAFGIQAVFLLVALAVLLWLAGGHGLARTRQVLLIPAWALLASAGAYALHSWALVGLGWHVGWVAPAMLLILAAAATALLEQGRTLVERKRIFQNFASYVSAPVASKVALSEPSGAIQARNCEVTILTVDIKNFARYCEACQPEDAASDLHGFFTTACTVVEQGGGVVEEMVGDSLVAVFNGELPCEKHPAAALRAACDIWRKCSAELPNAQALGLEPLAIGIGLESGKALVGSFGPAERRVHTVLGPTVAIAMRLRAMTPDLAYPILLGQELAQKMGAFTATEHMELKSLGSFLLPGLMSPSTIYTLRNLLQPGDALEQRTLLYLHQQQDSVA